MRFRSLAVFALTAGLAALVGDFASLDAQEKTNKKKKPDPAAPALGKSDYGTYLLRTLERWQGKPFVRGHLIIGDGADNGAIVSAIEQALKWKAVTPMHTFLVGTTTPPGAARAAPTVPVAPASSRCRSTSRAIATSRTRRPASGTP